MSQFCFICNKLLTEGKAVTVNRGMKTLIDSSIERNDEFVDYLKNEKSVTIHVQCRKLYTRKNSIASVKRQHDDGQPSTSKINPPRTRARIFIQYGKNTEDSFYDDRKRRRQKNTTAQSTDSSDDNKKKRKEENRIKDREKSQRYRDKKKYVALSRVTCTEGLFLITKENTKESWKFRHDRAGAPLDAPKETKNQKRSKTHRDLSMELERLKQNTLQTITKTFLDFISKRNGLSIFLFNCQSLRAHVADLRINVLVKKMNVLILTETHMNNEETLGIPNFNFVANFKRPVFPAGRVAIYQNSDDSMHMCTSRIDIHAKFTKMFGVNVSDIGDICVCRCQSENGQLIIMVAVYISPGKSMRAIQEFLFENLIVYSKEGSALLEKRVGIKLYEKPMILSGDFNINFADDKNLPLIEFLNEEFGLIMSNDRHLSTSRNKTTIDAVFTRHLYRFESKLFVSYFSYHKPIVSFLEYGDNDNDNNARVVEIMGEDDAKNSNIVEINESIVENSIN